MEAIPSDSFYCVMLQGGEAHKRQAETIDCMTVYILLCLWRGQTGDKTSATHWTAGKDREGTGATDHQFNAQNLVENEHSMHG